MPILYLDCRSGLGGDMFLAALADLGLDLAPLEDLFRKAGLDLAIRAVPASAHGVAGRRLAPELPGAQPLRHLRDLTDIVDRLDLSAAVRERALAALRRLAEAEAAAHSCPVDHVHFHEVGALDTLMDVVGACWGLERLGVEQVIASSLPWFGGYVDCDHGRLPLPSPAATALLLGKPVFPTDVQGELITPTGALLIDQLVDGFAPGPQGRLLASGVGYGTKEFPGHYNGLRAFLLEGEAGGRDVTLEAVWVLESNVDHLTGEELGHFFTALGEAGALDVAHLPAVMKKNRPGGLLQVQCAPADLERVRAAFFRHALTLGVRQTLATRAVLRREPAAIPTPWGELAAKRTWLDGQELVRPEFEALLEFSRRTGRSVAELRYLLGAGAAEDK